MPALSLQPAPQPTLPDRSQEVLAAISSVRDPEIDETVAALNFIVGTRIDGDVVTVSLRLPTFWCPANFVFLMAADMKKAVLALPWVRSFRMELVDHFAADEINRGVSEGLSFADVFPGRAEGDLEQLRRTFDEKAFLMRQGELLAFLRREGFADEALVAATVGEMKNEAGRSGGRFAVLWQSYADKRDTIGFGLDPQARAFVDAAGKTLRADALGDHLREIRKLTTSARSNGEMCRILMEARNSGSCGAVHAGQARHTDEKEAS